MIDVQPKFKSAFLCPDLRAQVDAISASNFLDVKENLLTNMREGNQFKDTGKHVKVFESITSHRKFQKTFYHYILAAEGMKLQIK